MISSNKIIVLDSAIFLELIYILFYNIVWYYEVLRGIPRIVKNNTIILVIIINNTLCSLILYNIFVVIIIIIYYGFGERFNFNFCIPYKLFTIQEFQNVYKLYSRYGGVDRYMITLWFIF